MIDRQLFSLNFRYISDQISSCHKMACRLSSKLFYIFKFICRLETVISNQSLQCIGFIQKRNYHVCYITALKCPTL